MTTAIHTVVFQTVRSVLNLDKEFEITENTTPDQVPGWDSFAWIGIITAVEERLDISIPLEKFDGVHTVGDFSELVRSENASRS